MTIDKQWIIERQGKQFVLYEGLLHTAHGQGLSRITTTLLQAPGESNNFTAIIGAEVETSKGRFSGIGDANPQNVGRPIVPHIIRMAETRAKARALRDALDIGATALEELGPDGSEDSTPAASNGVDAAHEKLLDQTTEALKQLSGVRKTNGKALMTEWRHVSGDKSTPFDMLNNNQLMSLRDWANLEIRKAQQPPVEQPEATQPATDDVLSF